MEPASEVISCHQGRLLGLCASSRVFVPPCHRPPHYASPRACTFYGRRRPGGRQRERSPTLRSSISIVARVAGGSPAALRSEKLEPEARGRGPHGRPSPAEMNCAGPLHTPSSYGRPTPGSSEEKSAVLSAQRRDRIINRVTSPLPRGFSLRDFQPLWTIDEAIKLVGERLRVFFTCGGRVRSTMISNCGQVVTLAHYGPAELFGESDLSGDGPREHSAWTTTPAIIAELPMGSSSAPYETAPTLSSSSRRSRVGAGRSWKSGSEISFSATSRPSAPATPPRPRPRVRARVRRRPRDRHRHRADASGVRRRYRRDPGDGVDDHLGCDSASNPARSVRRSSLKPRV